MFNLEQAIARWRETMQAAGIGPGEVRDELESHLRDAFEAQRRLGQEPETAFTAATARLGAARELGTEFQHKLGRWGRAKRLLGRRVELLPTDLRWQARATIPVGLLLVAGGIQTLYVNRISLDWDRIRQGDVFIPVFSALVFLAAFSGLRAALSYRRQPSAAAGKQLARFWSAILWLVSYVGLMILRAYASGSYATVNGRFQPILRNLPGWAAITLTLTMLVLYLDWHRRIGEAPTRDSRDVQS